MATKTKARTNPTRIPGLSNSWQNWLLSVLFHMLLPLLPILLELIFTNAISEQSITLAASMYTIEIGVSSRNRAIFGITIILSIIYAAIFGFVAGAHTVEISKSFSFIGILSVFVMHLLERINRHVIEKEPFLEFMKD
jgi:hypothetical protein